MQICMYSIFIYGFTNNAVYVFDMYRFVGSLSFNFFVFISFFLVELLEYVFLIVDFISFQNLVFEININKKANEKLRQKAHITKHMQR